MDTVLFVGSYSECRAYCHEQHATYDVSPKVQFPHAVDARFQVVEQVPRRVEWQGLRRIVIDPDFRIEPLP